VHGPFSMGLRGRDLVSLRSTGVEEMYANDCYDVLLSILGLDIRIFHAAAMSHEAAGRSCLLRSLCIIVL
jgi:hypothetical protein